MSCTYNRLLTGGATLFTKLKLFPPPVRSASSIRRGCHASAYQEDFHDEHIHSVPRVCCLPINGLCSDMFIPVAPPRCMRQTHQPPHTPPPVATRKAWSARENSESLTFRFDMPGLDKDKVKVRVEDDIFFIEAEPVKEFEEDEMPEGYRGRFLMPVGVYKMKEIKAEIKNGVLKVFLPKVKTEEKKKLDVWEVEVK